MNRRLSAGPGAKPVRFTIVAASAVLQRFITMMIAPSGVADTGAHQDIREARVRHPSHLRSKWSVWCQHSWRSVPCVRQHAASGLDDKKEFS